MKQIILIILFIIFFSYNFLLSQSKNIFWEKEQILVSGSISKFDVFHNNKIIGLLYNSKINKNKIFFKWSLDGINWSLSIELVNNLYFKEQKSRESINIIPNNIDFCGTIDKDNNLIIAYRIEEKKFIINKYSYPFINIIDSIIISEDNILYIPSINIDSNNNIIFLCLTSLNENTQIYYNKINNNNKFQHIDTKLIGGQYISTLNPYFTEHQNNYYIVFQAKETDIIPKFLTITGFNDDILKKLNNEIDKKYFINNYYKNELNNLYTLKDNITIDDRNKIIELLNLIKFQNPGSVFYNIILAISNDQGKNWSYRNLINALNENNQRPFINFNNNICNLSWERNDENLISKIYYTNFEINKWKPNKLLLVSNRTSEAHSSYLFYSDNFLYIMWYDDYQNKGMFQNYWATIVGEYIENVKPLSIKEGKTIENNIIVFNKTPSFFWNQEHNNVNNIYYLRPDKYCASPKPFVRNINKYKKTNKNEIEIEWDPVNDTSGIIGYRILLTDNSNDTALDRTKSEYVMSNVSSKIFDISNFSDGIYYFKIVAIDRANNISEESTYSFEIDKTPPAPPEFVNLEVDNEGYLLTNSPEIIWKSNDSDTISFKYYAKFYNNYTQEIIENIISQGEKNPFILTNESKINFNDMDNGVIIIGIQAIDNVGNQSSINWKVYYMNKYIVKTYITDIKLKQISIDKYSFNFYGRGFAIDGNINSIIVDKDKLEPYDYVIDKKYFDVISDRVIIQHTGVSFEDGIYYVGIIHPVRGLVFSNIKFKFEEKWAFFYKEDKTKFFDFNKFKFYYKIDLTKIFLYSIIVIWLIIVLFLFFSIINTAREKAYILFLIKKYKDIKTEYSNIEQINKNKEEQLKKLVKKGIGLTIKYTILILILVILIVTGTSIAISAITLKNQKLNLAKMMYDKSDIIMSNYYKTIYDIYYLGGSDFDAWNAMDSFIGLKDIGFVYLNKLTNNINIKSTTIKFGRKDYLNIFINSSDIDKLSKEEKEKIIIELLNNEKITTNLTRIKNELNDDIIIYPDYDPNNLANSYILIKPIILKEKVKVENNKEIINKKYIGEIAIGYSYISIIKMINDETINLVKIAFLITLIAIFISTIGAVILAAMTISPIRKMSRHVDVISKTDDYEKLLGTPNEKIEIKTRDEIGILAYAINDMTHKLIEKSKSDKQLLLGKEIQKKFIPLDPFENQYLEIYGYYEGAKGVSGDYFDYKKLDEENYAFIICDVSGKAVPAALIMVQISTIFRSYFTQYKSNKKISTLDIVTQINDTVEERGFQGRFAAILVMILNSKTGKIALTNAGYTQILIYRNNKKECEWIQLNPAGAAGVFPSFMLPQPFKEEYLKVSSGDVIFLFTDGIEESRNGKTIIEDGVEKADEFGQERIKQVLDKSENKTCKEIINDLMEAERKYRGDNEQYDDLTIIAIKKK